MARSKRKAGGDSAKLERAKAKVGEFVTLNVGVPDDLVELRVSRLHDDRHWRVTYVREVRWGQRTLADSFYLETTEDGFVSYCNPPLERRFHDDLLAA